MIENFKKYLQNERKSINTIESYTLDLTEYLNWFESSFNMKLTILHIQNIIDYKKYLSNVKRNNAKSINRKLNTLKKFNEYLISINVMNGIIITSKIMIKLNSEYAAPTKVTNDEVKQFLQVILETGDLRNYALVTLLCYTGLRISEALDIKLDDFNLESRECIIRSGKGDKQRIVIFNSKVITAINEYLVVREKYTTADTSPYLFLSKRTKKLDRTAMNKIFNKYSIKITPHQLRHFFCTNALENNLGIHEVAYLAGHSNIHTTLLYTNPDKEKIKKKLENL